MLKKLECSFTLVTNLKVSRLFPLDFRESDEDIQFGDILVHFHFIFLIEKNIFAKQFQIIERRYQWWHNLTLTWNSIRSSLLTQLCHINQSETERCPLNQNNMQTDSPFRKRFSKNVQQIYKRTPMSNCNFNKVASQLWRSASAYSNKIKSTEKNTVIKIKTFSETLIVIPTQVIFPRKYKPNKRYGTKYSKNGPSKICGRQPLKNFTWSILEYFFAYVW